jgi:hypothetical protein
LILWNRVHTEELRRRAQEYHVGEANSQMIA